MTTKDQISSLWKKISAGDLSGLFDANGVPLDLPWAKYQDMSQAGQFKLPGDSYQYGMIGSADKLPSTKGYWALDNADGTLTNLEWQSSKYKPHDSDAPDPEEARPNLAQKLFGGVNPADRFPSTTTSNGKFNLTQTKNDGMWDGTWKGFAPVLSIIAPAIAGPLGAVIAEGTGASSTLASAASNAAIQAAPAIATGNTSAALESLFKSGLKSLAGVNTTTNTGTNTNMDDFGEWGSGISGDSSLNNYVDNLDTDKADFNVGSISGDSSLNDYLSKVLNGTTTSEGTSYGQDGVSSDGTNVLATALKGGGANLISSLLKSLSTGKGITTGLGSLYGAYAQNNLADKQSELAKYILDNADPYKDYRKNTEIPAMAELLARAKGQFSASDDTLKQAITALTTGQKELNPATGYQYYDNKLHQSYDDPLAVYNSPQMQALNQIFQTQIERQDAAHGRNSQYGDRAVQMQNNFLGNLDKYRQGLTSSMGTIGQVENQGNSVINQANANHIADGTALAGLYGTQSTSALNTARLGMPGSATAGNGIGQYAQTMTGANSLGATPWNNLLQGLSTLYTAGS